MIIVRFTSGLGNQMFQYSLYRYLRDKYPETRVLADVTWFARFGEHQGYELERIFLRDDNPAFELEEATKWEILKVTGRFPNTLKGKKGDVFQNVLKVPHKIIRILAGKKHLRQRIDQTGFEDNAEIYEKIMQIDPLKDWYITGFFVEEIYYRERVDRLRSMFRFPGYEVNLASGKTDYALQGSLSINNRRFANKITGCHSISIHVRRGDYLSAQYSQSFIALPMQYYKNAAALAMQENPDSRFFIFSDDQDYILEAFKWIDEEYPLETEGNAGISDDENAKGGEARPSRITVVCGNTGKNSFRDLQLMSLCKANIIANSTFSEWAGLLNENPGAKVYYPRQYMQEKDFEEKTLPGWICVDSATK